VWANTVSLNTYSLLFLFLRTGINTSRGDAHCSCHANNVGVPPASGIVGLQWACVSYGERLTQSLKMLIAWNISSNVSKGRSTKDDQIRKLERDFKVMKDNYDKICSENQQLNALFTRQQKDKEKRRARDEALKEAREWRSSCERQV